MNTWKDVRDSMESGAPLDPVPTGMQVVPVVGLTFVEEYPGNVLGLQRLHFSEIVVELRRNPQNKYDSNAIEVHADGKMIGHIPKETAARLAPKLDGGTEHEAFVYGIRVSPDNPMNPGIDLIIGERSE